MANHLTLGVAGSGKTQRIVDHCASLPDGRCALVVTYTQANQAVMRNRLSKCAGHRSIEVMGWFTFLLREFARPFLPFKFPGKRVLGFNFDGQPPMKATGLSRFLDSNGAAYACELGRLAHELVADSGGALLHRLECIYDEILIDEVQDLSSHDWEIVDVLLGSSLHVRMVGDIRQSVLATNPRCLKNKKYAYSKAINWFRKREARGVLQVDEMATSWRCRPEITEFSDSIFDTAWSFPKTKSANQRVTGHDGVFLLRRENVDAYLARYRPQCLRDRANSGKALDLDYMNFGLSKGTSYERVLIVPTGGIIGFIRSGEYLKPIPAARLYVAVTRAEQSVAIVVDDPGKSTLPYWEP